MARSTTTTTSELTAVARIAELERLLAEERAKVAAVIAERDQLRDAYQRVMAELELMRRRLFVAKAERLDTTQLELEYAGKIAELDELNRQLGISPVEVSDVIDGGSDGPAPKPKRVAKPTGRRDLRQADVPEERIEILDPIFEGTAERIGWEESCRIAWRRGGPVRTVVARAKYRDVGEAGTSEPTIVTAPLPEQIVPRSLATPSLLAHLMTDKFCFGLPFHRQAERTAHVGLPIDRGLMCRWAEHLGATVGATVVHAMRDEALRTAFCIATDATGILVQPIQGGDQQRRGCQRAHFLVQIADHDHVFFEFLAKETSAAIGELFRGFSGYIQADAKSVYNLLYKPPDQRPPPDDGAPDLAERTEVGCWAHCRRKFWETAVTTKDPVAREAVLRIKRVFDLDRTWKTKSSTEIMSLRELHVRPHTTAFFAWAREQYEAVKDRRGMLRSALGYAVRQEGALTRFFDDGRLRLTNNESERELRRIATGRKAWLFVGSEDHGQAAGNLLSLIASARLHRLDPEAYLRDLFRVLPVWPSGRFLELAPKYWLATRARLDIAELEAELGPLTVPDPTPTTEQSASS